MCYVDFNGINAASVDENTKGERLCAVLAPQ